MWRRLGFGVGLITIVIVAGITSELRADPQSDLSQAKTDYAALRTRQDDMKGKLDQYLDESVKLRQMDKDQLNELISQICRIDIARDGDSAEQIAKDLRDKVIDQVRRSYDQTVNDGSHVFDDLGRLESDVKSLRDRVHNLEDKDEVKSDAAHLRDDIDKITEAIHRMFEKINTDKNTLDRVKDGVMAGSNNPTIRARMEYGKEMHRKLQSDRGCDEKEITLSSGGRPDCIKFDQDDCKVIEFKPDTYSTSQAEQQADGYVRDVRDRFKSDDRAKRCKQDSDGPIFKAKGELYAACRP